MAQESLRKDPIVEEIHLVREKIAKECNYDLKQIMNRMSNYLGSSYLKRVKKGDVGSKTT